MKIKWIIGEHERNGGKKSTVYLKMKRRFCLERKEVLGKEGRREREGK